MQYISVFNFINLILSFHKLNIYVFLFILIYIYYKKDPRVKTEELSGSPLKPIVHV